MDVKSPGCKHAVEGMLGLSALAGVVQTSIPCLFPTTVDQATSLDYLDNFKFRHFSRTTKQQVPCR